MAFGPLARWILLLGGEAILAVIVGVTFWLQDWQYSLPTPRPAALEQPALGSRPELPGIDTVTRLGNALERPTLLHFFNPSCPCSRFNAPHLRQLLAQFQGQVTVIAVLETDDPAQARDAFAAWDLNCPAIVDARGEIARCAGVYSTPQAVVLDGDCRLYYRGNYNLTRYCDEADTEFVRLALDACLAKQRLPEFPAAAMIAQGCPLPIDRPSLAEEPSR